MPATERIRQQPIVRPRRRFVARWICLAIAAVGVVILCLDRIEQQRFIRRAEGFRAIQEIAKNTDLLKDETPVASLDCAGQTEQTVSGVDLAPLKSEALDVASYRAEIELLSWDERQGTFVLTEYVAPHGDPRPVFERASCLSAPAAEQFVARGEPGRAFEAYDHQVVATITTAAWMTAISFGHPPRPTPPKPSPVARAASSVESAIDTYRTRERLSADAHGLGDYIRAHFKR